MVIAGGSPDLVSSWGASSAALALLVVAIAFNITNQRGQRRDIRDLRHENAVCNYRTWILVGVLDANGFRVPANFYEQPPEGIAEMTTNEQQRHGYRRGRFDLFSQDEDGATDWRFLLGLVALFLVSFVVIGIVLNRFVVQPLSDVQDTQHAIVHVESDLRAAQRANDKILARLDAARRQAKCTSIATSVALGEFIDRTADNFQTPPYPDPGRVTAVQGLRDLAAQFNAAKPVPCPAPAPTTTTRPSG